MKILHFVHSYNEKNGISLHVANLEAGMPAGAQARVIGGSGFSFPLFSSLRFPLKEIFDALSCDFDVMHVHGYGNFYSFFGALIAMLKGKKLVWTIHGYPQIRGMRRLFYFVYRYLMAPVVFFKAARIISVSSDIVPLLEKETRKEIIVIPNGVDFGLFKPAGDYKDAKYVCYVGRLDADKGVGRMLECTSLPVLFVGPDEGGMKGKLQDMAAGKNVRAFFEEAPYGEMPHEYGKCRYVVLPSKYEGFPLTMLEAVACERPFICTDVGEVRKVMGGLFDRPGEFLLEGDLQQKLDALEHKDFKVELKEARKRAAKYSWGSVAQKVVEVYGQL